MLHYKQYLLHCLILKKQIKILNSFSEVLTPKILNQVTLGQE